MESYDTQSTHLKQILVFIGFTDIKHVFVEPTLYGFKFLCQALW
jgi:FMN-dependent NADH-azoreductase